MAPATALAPLLLPPELRLTPELVIELASASEAGPRGAEALRRKLAAPSAACANPSEVGAVVEQQRLENATRLEGGDVLPGLVLELEEIWAG